MRSRKTMAAPSGHAEARCDAWVIAAGDYGAPIYWSGAGWSGNPRHAVLLVRREDAVRVAINMNLMGPEWDVPDDVRPEPAVKLSPAAMVRRMGEWRTGYERRGPHLTG